MIKQLSIAAGIIALSAFAPAHALTITNNDTADYEVTIVEGQGDGATSIMQLQAGANLADICENGCTVTLSSGAEQAFEGGETVIIEDGAFVMAE